MRARSRLNDTERLRQQRRSAVVGIITRGKVAPRRTTRYSLDDNRDYSCCSPAGSMTTPSFPSFSTMGADFSSPLARASSRRRGGGQGGVLTRALSKLSVPPPNGARRPARRCPPPSRRTRVAQHRPRPSLHGQATHHQGGAVTKLGATRSAGAAAQRKQSNSRRRPSSAYLATTRCPDDILQRTASGVPPRAPPSTSGCPAGRWQAADTTQRWTASALSGVTARRTSASSRQQRCRRSSDELQLNFYGYKVDPRPALARGRGRGDEVVDRLGEEPPLEATSSGPSVSAVHRTAVRLYQVVRTASAAPSAGL